MGESEKRLKANRLIAGTVCGWCNKTIEFGEDIAVCRSCEAPQHADCWDHNGGCAAADCSNAPLTQLEEPDVAALAEGKTNCLHCNQVISATDEICGFCSKAQTPDGVYTGPRQNAEGAVASMVWGIIGLFFCGLILGIVAIVKSNSARAAIETDPRLGGSGYATAGLVLGIIDLIAWGLWVVMRAGGSL